MISATSREGVAAVTDPLGEYRTVDLSSQAGLNVSSSYMAGLMTRCADAYVEGTGRGARVDVCDEACEVRGKRSFGITR